MVYLKVNHHKSLGARAIQLFSQMFPLCREIGRSRREVQTVEIQRIL